MSGDRASLINLGDISKPATVLIEKISDAIGGMARPWQVKRVASAEAKADLLRAQTRVEISEIEERGLLRMIRAEGHKQENIESIVGKSIPLLSHDAKPENIEDDWITHFFERSKMISDNEMQSLWANILSSEANKPGSFSKRTVEIVASLDKVDAQAFTAICSCVWMIGDLTLVIHDANDASLGKHGVTFETINHADDIGLLTFANIAGFIKQDLPDTFRVTYFERQLLIIPPINVKDFSIGTSIFTKAGQQLAGICGSAPTGECYLHGLKGWYDLGYTLISPLP